MTDTARNDPGGCTGIVVAGLGGGSGKSVVAVGLAAVFTEIGHTVIPFKKGPDYIDAGWLSLATGNPCYNLDPYMMDQEIIKRSFLRHAALGRRVIMEGNRGLYDGVDVHGSFSTAELSVILGLPVLLVIDCTKTTRTVAALVLGCRQLDPRVHIAGAVLNRIGSSRHESIVRQSVETYTDVPVLGAIPRSTKDVFPQRHLGLTPFQEHTESEEAIKTLAASTRQYLDLGRIDEKMVQLPLTSEDPVLQKEQSVRKNCVKIGILKDAAFQFYYPDNLEALEKEGAELVEINALTDAQLPALDGLYIGGGFPETSLRQLSANESFRKSVKEAAEKGLPIYAECGGLIYLGESLELDGDTYPLAGIFPVRFGLERKPQAHGYTKLTVDRQNPFYAEGTRIRGHEFRYSKVLRWSEDLDDLTLEMERGVGFAGHRDGLVYNNVLALYTHIHALSTPQWAPALVDKSCQYRNTQCVD